MSGDRKRHLQGVRTSEHFADLGEGRARAHRLLVAFNEVVCALLLCVGTWGRRWRQHPASFTEQPPSGRAARGKLRAPPRDSHPHWYQLYVEIPRAICDLRTVIHPETGVDTVSREDFPEQNSEGEDVRCLIRCAVLLLPALCWHILSCTVRMVPLTHTHPEVSNLGCQARRRLLD